MSEVVNWTRRFGKLALNMPAAELKRSHINILICGPAGHGKSATGNSILGRGDFTVSSDGESETTSIESKSTTYEDYKVKVVDCPPAPSQHPINVKQVMKSCGLALPKLLKMCPSGFHCAIVVLKYGNRVGEQDEYAMAMLKAMFGEDYVSKHVICVISNGDMFKGVMKKSKTPQNINDWCKAQKRDSALGRMFQACSYRCVLFDNFTDDVNVKREQLQQLMSMIISSWPQVISLSFISVTPTMRVRADIHMLIETASSENDYQNQLKFIVSYTGKYQIGTDRAQVSVTICGESDHLQFDFKNHGDLAKAIMNAPYLKPCSGTDRALTLVRRESLNGGGGARHGEKQMLVMVTEGKCKDESKAVEEANTIKSSGTEILVVAAACIDRTVMAALASSPESVFIADDYDQLEDLSKEVATKTAEIAPQFESTADILFILDSSGSISSADYQRELDFVVYLIECFNIGRNAVQFSTMIFSDSPKMLFDFSSNSHEQIKEAVLAASHIHGGTNTAAALELARTRAFTTGNGCRDGKKIAIVITDGYSNDRRATIHEAERLTDSGVLILVIGVGNIDQVELESTASFSEDVYMVDNYKVLDTIKDEIANRTSKIEMLKNRPR